MGDPDATFNIDPTFTDAEVLSIRQAGRTWSEATDWAVDFSFVVEPGSIAEHKLRIVKRRGLIDGRGAGCTTAEPGGDVVIQIQTDLPVSEGKRLSFIECTALHELGHYMGLKHSFTPEDVMCGFSNDKREHTSKGYCVLSPGDIEQFHDVTGL